jgi:hypothetical protein
MLVSVDGHQGLALQGAAKTVATGGGRGTLSIAAPGAIRSLAQFGLGMDPPGIGTPHDCTHLISSYDTTPRGGLLVSTFTSRMHPVFPMA